MPDDNGACDNTRNAPPIPRTGGGVRATSSARDIVRRLLGETPFGPWKIRDVRASSGVRVALFDEAAARSLVVVLRPPGHPGFVNDPRVSVMKVGASLPEERPLLAAIADRVRRGATTFADGELEAALDAASRVLAPVVATEVRHQALRPAHAELRLNLACNQACFFCNCDSNAPNVVPEEQAALAAARQFGQQGVSFLTITGGEPTLRRMLPDVARAAREAGVKAVLVQTNAVALADSDLAIRLRDAGVTHLFVSLHSTTPEVSDRITACPGSHALTLRGIEAALDAALVVETNFVISRLNMEEPSPYVRWLRDRFARRIARRVFSFVAPVGAQLRNLDLMPRISEALPFLREALDECRAAGEAVRVAGICGLPLCVMRGYEDLCDEADNVAGVPLADDRMKADACSSCAHEPRCSGFWRKYVDVYGDGELVPLESRA